MRVTPPRTILHLDADAFFASCEIASDPRLKNAPLAVGGLRRGVIASANYEARLLGVYAPMPTSKALQICPNLIVVPGDYEKYERVSAKLFEILRNVTPFVEESSIDEGYGDVSGIRNISAWEIGSRLRSLVKENLNLSVSVGLGSNKLVSSIASKLHKPDCLTEVSSGLERDFLHPLSVKWLPGVGPKLEKTLLAASLHLIADVDKASLALLSSLAGTLAPQLKSYSMGVDLRSLVTDPVPAKSYGKQLTFEKDVKDEDAVLLTLRGMIDSLMEKIRSEGKMIRSVEVLVKLGDKSQSRRSETLAEPTDLETDVYAVVDSLLRRAWTTRSGIRLVGVKLSRMYDSQNLPQVELGLTGYDRSHHRALVKAMDEIRTKYGKKAAQRGHRLLD